MSISSNSTDSNSQVRCGARENEYIGANFPFRQPDDDDGCRCTTTVYYDCASSAVKQTMAIPNIDNGNNIFTKASTFSGPASKMPFEQRIHQLNCNIPLANMAESASSANSPCNMEVYRSLSKSPSSSISSSHASQAIHDFNDSTLTPFCCSTNIIPSGKRRNGNKSTARRNQATGSNNNSGILYHHDNKNSKPRYSKNKTGTENKFGGSGESISQSNNCVRTNTSLSISSSQMKRSFETMLKEIDYDLNNLRQPSVFFSCGSHINSIHTKKWSEKERKDLIALADRWLPSKKRGSGGERKMMKSGEKEGVDDEKVE